MAGFIFGAGTPYKSHADIMRQREIANALIQQSQAGASVNSVPEGVANLGVGILAALMGAKARRDEAKGKASYNDSFKAVTRSLLGGQGPQASGPFKGTVVPTSAPPPGVPEAKATVQPAALSKPASNPVPKKAMGIIEYANQKAIRNDPLSRELTATLQSFLPDLGVTVKVFSGGQEASGPTRTGSRRHDHGNAADVFFYKDGRRLDWNNPDDLPIFQEIVRRGKAAGLTGFGAGPGYMQPGSMHIGFGTPGIWGAGGRGANAPDWLRTAYAGGGSPMPSSAPLMVQMASAAPSSGIGPMGFQAPQMPATAAPVSQPQIMPASAPPPQAAPAAPAMGNQPMTAYQRTFARSQEREGGNVGPIARGQMARVMGQDPAQAMAPPQGGQPMAGGFFTSMLPAGFPPEQAATVQQAEASLDGMPIEQIAELASSPYAEDWQKNLMQQYLEHRMKLQFAPPPDPLDQRRKELEIAKLEQGLQPPAPSPTDDMREYQYAITQGYKGTFADWQTQNRKAGATNINMGGGTDKQIYESTEKRADAARAARTGLFSLEEAQKALPGAITGAAADQRLALQKIGALFGVADTQSIVDTETFRSAIAPQVAAMLKATVGSTQISNADREFAEKAAAGSISLDGESIAKLINIMQAANSEIIRSFNADLQRIYPSEGGQFERERAIFNVPNVPRRYTAPIGPQMPNNAPQPEQSQQPEKKKSGGFDTELNQLKNGQFAEGPDGTHYQKRNNKLFKWKKGEGWSEVK